jgi:hypothetical protein
MLRTVDRILLGTPLLFVVGLVTAEARGDLITEPPTIHTNQDDVPPLLRHWMEEKKPYKPSFTKEEGGDGEDPPPTAHTNQDGGDGGEDFTDPPQRERRNDPPFISAAEFPFGDPKEPAASVRGIDWPDLLNVQPRGDAVYPRGFGFADALSWPVVDFGIAMDRDRDDRFFATPATRPGTIPAPGAAALLGLGAITLLSGRRRRTGAAG